MNSDFLRDNEEILEEVRDVKQVQAEATTQACGELAGSFKNHQFWKVFEKDLKILRESLVKALIVCKGQRMEIMNLQNQIKILDLVISTPDKYIDRLNSLLSRKRRERG
jgi:hypothetical protein